jgi:hypothetical protein
MGKNNAAESISANEHLCLQKYQKILSRLQSEPVKTPMVLRLIQIYQAKIQQIRISNYLGGIPC